MTKLLRYLLGVEEAKAVTTRTFAGNSWYMASKVCAPLGIVNYSQAVHNHLELDEWCKETLYKGGFGKKKVLLVNDVGVLKLIKLSRSRRGKEIQELARRTPAHLKTEPWPEELFTEQG